MMSCLALKKTSDVKVKLVFLHIHNTVRLGVLEM